MSNLGITTHDSSTVVVLNPVFAAATASFTAAETWPKGAILGRVTADGKYKRTLATASDGSELAKAVLTEPLIAAVAGDKRCNILIQGIVKKSMLVDHGGTAVTDLQVEELRDYGIIAQDITNLSHLDNE